MCVCHSFFLGRKEYIPYNVLLSLSQDPSGELVAADSSTPRTTEEGKDPCPLAWPNGGGAGTVLPGLPGEGSQSHS